MKQIIYILMVLIIVSCKEDKGLSRQLPPAETKELLKNNHAEGFTLIKNDNYSILTISNPWPKADKVYRYALIPKENAPKITLNKDDFDGMIITPVQKIVVTSTTHIPALELLGVEQTLVGFPGTDYISSEKTRTQIDNGDIRELGNNEGINTEVLLELRPDVVVTFGVDGTNKTMETIEKAGITVIYNGDWVEKSPLAKAEWIKFFGALYHKESQAKSIFDQIEKDYLEAKSIAAKASKKPTVLCGAMYKDVWYLPNGTSPEAQFLNDANVNYLWSETKETGSIALNFETVFDKAKTAELWLSPSYYLSYDALEKANSHYTQFDAFQNKKIFTFSNTTGKTGGVLYYELGAARPDLVLKDMIKICHPELLTDYKTTFFKPLD
ncbi:ABC transporter substrate-binding protein [uncultured Psychroserpens sp.]|uniref:ABC transporter substrate-binding protein n=1 Tax=uncultured Psychroserpens sp. TaxID=255436 RepID=UPI002612CDF4|nr:ABC transporter substrate-binding protein [uncultured Psychroserpens sp.]